MKFKVLCRVKDRYRIWLAIDRFRKYNLDFVCRKRDKKTSNIFVIHWK